MKKGTLKFFNSEKGFGFITNEETSKDILIIFSTNDTMQIYNLMKKYNSNYIIIDWHTLKNMEQPLKGEKIEDYNNRKAISKMLNGNEVNGFKLFYNNNLKEYKRVVIYKID